MKTIRGYGNITEAGVAQSRLREAGIDASVLDENAAAIGLKVRLQVREEDVERAVQILDNEGGLNAESTDLPQDDVDMQADHEVEPGDAAVPTSSSNSNDVELRAPRIVFWLVLGFVVMAALGIAIPIIREYFPQDSHAYFRKGTTREHAGDLDGAMADFTQAIELNPQFAAAYCMRGIVKRAKGDPAGAIADFTRAIQLDPYDSTAYFDRGILESDDDMDKAISDMSQAITLSPDIAEYYWGRAFAEGRRGDDDMAREDDEQAIRLAPDSYEAHLFSGSVKLSKGDLDGALAEYDQAIALAPKKSPEYRHRAFVEDIKGDYDKALTDEMRQSRSIQEIPVTLTAGGTHTQ